jgi:hypothetical protein
MVSVALRQLRLFIIAVILCAIGVPAVAQPKRAGIFPLKDIRQGMRATGRTVFSGERVEDFQVEILGVLENIGPKQSLILARLSGGPLAQTGVMQGMSGSPVYMDGRLVGAVAMAFPFSKEPIAGIRLFDSSSLTANFEKPLPVSSMGSKLVNIATPVSFSGFTSAAIEHFAPQMRALGLEPMQGFSGGSSSGSAKQSPGRPIEPGSMISVQLISGDLSVGADGTVTSIDGNRIYAFGHRFLSVGATELPFARASVLALLPNLSSSFKISSTGEQLGTITADHSTAIAGELGRKPALVPLSITVNGPNGPTAYKMEMVNDNLLSPLLLQMALYSALDATERTLGTGTIRLRAKMEFQNNPVPVQIENMFAGDFNVPLQASLSTALPLAYALQNNADDLRLKKVDLVLDSYTEKKQMSIAQAWVSKREVHPGESVDVTALLVGDNGREFTKTLSYPVPIGAPLGTLYFTIADGTTMNVTEYQQFSVLQPRPSKQILTLLNKLHGNTKGYMRVWRNEASFLIESHDLAGTPPSVAMILARTQPGSGNAARNTMVAEMEFDAGDAVISGSRTVQVEVKE